ncbi:MAG: tetratricopeptide repeat protein, partial [Leptospiraceae bacterium]|nr:tetratricopeptide repeat protein [Leptospiraceae bacterium]
GKIKDFKKQKQYFEKSISILESLNQTESDSYAKLQSGLCSSHVELKEYVKALQYCKKAEKLFKELNLNTYELGSVYSNIGIVLEQQKKKDEAFNYFKKSDKVFLRTCEKCQISLTPVYRVIDGDFLSSCEVLPWVDRANEIETALGDKFKGKKRKYVYDAERCRDARVFEFIDLHFKDIKNEN